MLLENISAPFRWMMKRIKHLFRLSMDLDESPREVVFDEFQENEGY